MVRDGQAATGEHLALELASRSESTGAVRFPADGLRGGALNEELGVGLALGVGLEHAALGGREGRALGRRCVEVARTPGGRVGTRALNEEPGVGGRWGSCWSLRRWADERGARWGGAALTWRDSRRTVWGAAALNEELDVGGRWFGALGWAGEYERTSGSCVGGERGGSTQPERWDSRRTGCAASSE